MSIIAGFVMPHPPIIIREIGKGQEKEISKTIEACEKVAEIIGELKPDTIILTSPHATNYEHYFHISPGKYAVGNFEKFGAKDINMNIEYDEDFVKKLSKEAWLIQLNAGYLGEKEILLDHGTMVPLYFVNKVYKEYKLVRIGLSGLPREENLKLGKLISRVSEEMGKKTIFIASGDLSHKLKEDGPYGFAKEGATLDKQIMDILSKGQLERLYEINEDLCDKAAECGLGSFLIMAGALEGKKIKTEISTYEGPFGVGYGVASYKVEEEKKDIYVDIARYCVESFIKDGKKHKIFDIENHFHHIPNDLLHKKGGVFVTIKKQGKLRGCIGTVSPVAETLAGEIIANSISAATEDPRFDPIGIEELSNLEYSVDVLEPPEPINTLEMLDPKNYGIIVSHGRLKGLLLPDIEGVDTVEDQISIALSKAGLSRYDSYKLERFKVVRHK